MTINTLDQNYLKTLTVLYVEDDADTRIQFSDFLRRPVGTLVVATNGVEGVEAFIKATPDIVITDIHMPLMDGLTMAAEIRKLAPTVPIIITTAFEQTDYLMRAINIGIDKYVVKPVNSYLLFENLLDCAHRQRAEEQLHRVQEQKLQDMAEKQQKHHDELRTIFELSNAGIILGDNRGVITFASPRMANMLGRPIEELAGSSYVDHVHPDDCALITGKLQGLLAGWDGNIDTEHRFVRADGTFFWGHLTASCIKDEDNNLQALVGVVSDVSDRKHAEEERALLEHQLLHSQKLESVGVLAGGIAHDFNNVLTIINGYAALLQATLIDDPENLGFVKEISASVVRATDMTRSLLAFSGKHEVLLRYDDLNLILANLRNSLGRLIREDILLAIGVGEERLPVYVDRVQIEQLLINLVVNAGDAIGTGGTISVATMLVNIEHNRMEGNAVIPPGEYVCLCVADSGSGMDAETIEHIFEPFFTTKEKGKGTGLGLAIVHSIVAKHNGCLSVISAPGAGTEFRIYLPQYVGEIPLGLAESDETLDLRGTETVLMVEDDKSVMKLHKEMLGRYGYTVLHAYHGIEALELFNANRDKIQIVVVDVIMPHLNGGEVVRQIRQQCPELPVIMTSGYTDEIIDRASIDELKVIFLQKPVQRFDLLATIHRCLHPTA